MRFYVRLQNTRRKYIQGASYYRHKDIPHTLELEKSKSSDIAINLTTFQFIYNIM